MTSVQRILINGGGLAGFGLAIGLARRNISSTIFEIRNAPSTIGGAIALAPNALRVLDKQIGIYDIVKSTGFEYERMNLFSDDGLQLGTVVSGSRELFGYPALRVMRSSVHNALVECSKEYSDKISIHWDASVEKIKELDSAVEVVLNNGETIEGTILVGADGIHSKVREYVLGEMAPVPEYSGSFGVGGIVARDDIDWGNCKLPALIFSQKGVVLAIPVTPTGDKVGWSVQQSMASKTREGWDQYIKSGQALQDCRNKFESPPQPLADILDKTAPDSMRGWAPYLIPDLETWHTSRVVLVGDAAHAIPPHAGQGAAQAFEDVALLARFLSEPEALKNGYEAMFGHFERLRKGRFSEVRAVTKLSSRSRETSTSWLFWTVKKYLMWAFLRFRGVENTADSFFKYEINELPLTPDS